MRRLMLMVAMLAWASVADAAYSVKFTPPDRGWTSCALTVDSAIVVPNIIPAAVCTTDPPNDCLRVDVALQQGPHAFQIVCTAPRQAASNILTYTVVIPPTATPPASPVRTVIPTATPTPIGTHLEWVGTAIVRVTAPSGSGSKSLSVIHDGVLPAVGSTNPLQQYDTYTGAIASDDWIGYTFASAQFFTHVVFQEGMNFADGGWFTTLRVQVRKNGVWVDVSGVQITPPYPPNDTKGYETYALTFPTVIGDGIRLDGTPGGAHAFISVGELQVYGGPIVATPVPTSTAGVAAPKVLGVTVVP